MLLKILPQQQSQLTPSLTELTYVKGVTSAIQTQLGLKAPLASPTFTGTVTIPTPFTIGAVSMTATGTELNYVAGVTSAIQTQIDGKAATGQTFYIGTTQIAINRASRCANSCRNYSYNPRHRNPISRNTYKCNWTSCRRHYRFNNNRTRCWFFGTRTRY